MAIILRSRREIELLREAGRVVAEVLLKLKEAAAAGVSTAELNAIAEEMAAKANAQPLFRGVKNPYGKKPFPAVICSSLNEQVVHGIPSKDVVLKGGDVLSVDFGVKLNGYCGDAATTLAIGKIGPEKQRLLDATKRMLDFAIEQVRPGIKWSRIAAGMQKIAEDEGFSVVREFVGHGIGRDMHEEPKVPNFVSDELLRHDILLQDGMILAVEPMVNFGKCDVLTLKDGWTVVARDGRPSAHFEHTIAVVAGGCEVMTEI